MIRGNIENVVNENSKTLQEYRSCIDQDGFNVPKKNGPHRKKTARNVVLIITIIISISVIISLIALTMENKCLYPDELKYLSNIKGVESLIKNGYYQKIDKYCEDKGIRLTVDYIIGDRKKLFIAYSVENKANYNSLSDGEIEILDKSNENLIEGKLGSIIGVPVTEGKTKHIVIEMDKYGNNEVIPAELQIRAPRFVDEFNAEIKGDWKINFKIKSKLILAKPKIYSINKEISLHGIEFKIKEIKSYPTSTQLVVENYKQNTKQILFSSSFLSNENGKRYKNIVVYPLHRIEDEVYEEFDSIFFDSSSKLTLCGERVVYIAKEIKNITIDVKNEKIIDDSGFEVLFEQKQEKDDDLYLELTVRNNKKQSDFPYLYLDSIASDENDNKYDISPSGIINNSETIIIKNFNSNSNILNFKVIPTPHNYNEKFNIELF